MNRILSFSWSSLVAGVCLVLNSSVHADLLGVSPGGPINFQVVRPLDGSEVFSFNDAVVSMAEGASFGGFSVDSPYNANGERLITQAFDLSLSEAYRGIPPLPFLFLVTIDSNTPLGLYNSSSPTSYQPASFRAFAYSFNTGEETHLGIPLTIEVLANPEAVPEPSSALLLGLGVFAAFGGCARRRARTP